MNKSILIIVGIIVVGGLVFAFTNKEDSVDQSVKQEETEVPAGTFRGSMRDLAAKNEPTRCTFTHATEVGSSAGVVYVADGNVYGDFDIDSTVGGEFKAYMITDGTDSYVWSSASSQGFKVSLADVDTQTSAQAPEGVDYNQSLDYQCEPWTKDLSVFVPPADITFIAVSDIPQMPATLPEGFTMPSFQQ